MMARLRPQLPLVATTLLVALLSGCVTPGPTPRLFTLAPAPITLETTPAAPQPSALPQTILIQEVRLPAYLDRPEIVRRDTVNRLTWSEINQWGSPLGEDMTRVLAMNLAQMLTGYRIITTTPPLSSPPDYRLEIEVRRFERLADGPIELVAEWSVTRTATRKLMTGTQSRFVGETLPAEADYDQTVNAMSVVYADFARAIGHAIHRHEATGR